MISASDIEKYTYCPLSWYLSKRKRVDIKEGEEKHRKIAYDAKKISEYESEKVKTSSLFIYYLASATIIIIVGYSFIVRDEIFSRILLLLSLGWALYSVYLFSHAEKYEKMWEKKMAEKVMLIAALSAMVLSILAVTIFLPPNSALALTIESASFVWLMGANIFYYLSVIMEYKASALRGRLKLPSGEVILVDDLTKGKTLYSEKYGISGTPDLIIKEGEHYIPVEIKTGRVPRGPLFSHIMQLAAYCLLVEENYGTPPPYGILKYGSVMHEIEWNEDLKNLLLKKVAEMRNVMKTGDVHRNHNRVGKCLHCSRRDICPEKLG